MSNELVVPLLCFTLVFIVSLAVVIFALVAARIGTTGATHDN